MHDVPEQDEVVEAVLVASRAFVAVASRALAGIEPEVTLPQFRTLVLLDAQASMTMTALADALGVAPSTATRMCNRLVAKRLVRRATDRANRRQVNLSLLPEGRRLIDQSTRRRREEFGRLLATVSPERQGHLVEALGVLIDAAAEQPPPSLISATATR